MSNIKPQNVTAKRSVTEPQGNAVLDEYYFGIDPMISSMFYATVRYEQESGKYNTQLYLLAHGKPEWQRILLLNACLDLDVPTSVNTIPFSDDLAACDTPPDCGQLRATQPECERFRISSIPSAGLCLTLRSPQQGSSEMTLQIQQYLTTQWTIGEADISIIDPQFMACEST